MARTRILPLILAVSVGFAAVGCSASTATDPAPTLEVAPATGEVITGTGYTFAVPEGWGDPGPVEGFDPDSLAADLTDADGFTDNVNVILSPAGRITPDQVETDGLKELEGAGATDLTVEPRVTVAGSESAHLSGSLAAGATEYAVEQFYVSDADQTYVVTFSFSSDVSKDARDALSGAVLASWKFAD